MTGFRNAQLKQAKQIFLTLKKYQNMFIDSLVLLHAYSVLYLRSSCDFNVMS